MRLASTLEKPRMVDLHEALARFCIARNLRPPSRAAIYRLLDRTSGHGYDMKDLPSDVRMTLHNVAETARVPGGQVAFHCFNYGNVRALCFAAGMPWLDLHHARLKRGWRAKSRGVLDAVCRARGI